MIDGYKDIVQALKYHKGLYEAANVEYEYYYKILHNRDPKDIGAQCMDCMPKADKNQMDTSRAVIECKRWGSMMDIEQEHIDTLSEKLNAIDRIIDDMTDIKIKVAQLRAMGLTQEQVAEIVEKSTRQVQRIDKKMSCDMSC